jgi:hypothetical protein
MVIVIGLTQHCGTFLIHSALAVYTPDKASLDRPALSSRSCLSALALTALFTASSCGSERVFQTMQFTFGLCGELKLAPDQAVKTDIAYSMGFLFGR